MSLRGVSEVLPRSAAFDVGSAQADRCDAAENRSDTRRDRDPFQVIWRRRRHFKVQRCSTRPHARVPLPRCLILTALALDGVLDRRSLSHAIGSLIEVSTRFEFPVFSRQAAQRNPMDDLFASHFRGSSWFPSFFAAAAAAAAAAVRVVLGFL